MNNVAVVGGGLMGSGIAEVSARAGHDVIVIESNEDAGKAALGGQTGGVIAHQPLPCWMPVGGERRRRSPCGPRAVSPSRA